MNYMNLIFKNVKAWSCFLAITIMILFLITTLPITAAAESTNRIEIYTYGPGTAQVVDIYGRRSGRDLATGDILMEIPRSEVIKEGTRDRIPGWTVHIEDPAQGLYRIKLLATGPGAFAIDVDTVDSAGNLRNHHIFRRVKTGDTLELLLTYSSEPGAQSTLLEQ